MFRKALFFFFASALALLLSACATKGPTTVTVDLAEFSIESSLTSFEAGETYRFVITNVGALSHELTIMPAGLMVAPMEGHEGHDMEGAMLHVGEEQLAGGATVTVEYTFAQSMNMNELEFACHLPGHYEAGMLLPIEVSS